MFIHYGIYMYLKLSVWGGLHKNPVLHKKSVSMPLYNGSECQILENRQQAGIFFGVKVLYVNILDKKMAPSTSRL